MSESMSGMPGSMSGSLSGSLSGSMAAAAPQSRQARLERLDQANSVVVSRLRELSRERAVLASMTAQGLDSPLAVDLAHEADDVTDLLCRHLAQLHNTVALEVRGVRSRGGRTAGGHPAQLAVVPPEEGASQAPSPGPSHQV